MLTIETLADKVSEYLEPPQVNFVKRAYFYAEQAHDGQMRRSGEPYVTHPLAVADILADMHLDHQSLMAAMLHDVIEDTGISREALEEQFGESVAYLVDGVSKLTQIEFGSRAEKQAENFQKMALAMAKDIRVILVKLADRLHNMRTLGVLHADKRRRIAKETLEIYAPISNRLGMNNMRIEFEDLGFAALYPMRSRRIKAAVKKSRGNRTEIVEKIQQAITDALKEENIEGRVIGREKHLYSIYQKMLVKRKSFANIMDVYAFRIVLQSVDDCYRVLGIIHNLYKPVAGQFKDYIAVPKANGYQSLHTVLFGMHGVPIEVQVRTEEMNEMANKGIAAHWLYKSKNGADPNDSQERARQWVKGLLELQQSAGNSLEFIENVKIDLFPDEIYVFTPKGNILELPAGATPVDFAYAVHTDVGNTCVACRINRRLRPLSEPLQSGNTVSIITASGAQPNPAWLNFVISGKARSAIRHYLKNQRHSESIALGKRLLNKALMSIDSKYEDIGDDQKEDFVRENDETSFDHVLEDIGLGNRLAYSVAKRLLPDFTEPKEETSSDRTPLIIEDAEGMMISFAKCCYPLPGDPIACHMSTGRGIVVHRDDCKNLAEFEDNPEKFLPVNWSQNVEGEFLVELHLELENKRGIVAILASKIADQHSNIEKISLEERDAKVSIAHVLLYVTSRVHLANIMRRVKTVKAVTKITRAKN